MAKSTLWVCQHSYVNFAQRWGKTRLLSLNDILTAVRNVSTHKRLAVSWEIKVITLLHVNPCSSASGNFFNSRRVKTWLRSTITQKWFNSVWTLNSHKFKTDNLDWLATVHNFVCNDNRRRNFCLFTRNDL